MRCVYLSITFFLLTLIIAKTVTYLVTRDYDSDSIKVTFRSAMTRTVEPDSAEIAFTQSLSPRSSEKEIYTKLADSNKAFIYTTLLL